jgi:hypothetical protein
MNHNLAAVTTLWFNTQPSNENWQGYLEKWSDTYAPRSDLH